MSQIYSVESYTLDHKGKEWKGVLREWLSLFRSLRNPRAFYQGRFLKDVLLYRLVFYAVAISRLVLLKFLFVFISLLKV